MKLIFEWDEKKAKSNFQKHHIHFDEGKTIFSDPLLLTYPDESHSYKEERFISLGYSYQNRILLAVHTEHQETENSVIVRIISCRKATHSEREFYEEY